MVDVGSKVIKFNHALPEIGPMVTSWFSFLEKGTVIVVNFIGKFLG